MPTQSIAVTVDFSTTPPTFSYLGAGGDTSGDFTVAANSTDTLEWTRAGKNATDWQFVDIAQPAAGSSGNHPRLPSGIFGSPNVATDGSTISIVDSNIKAQSKGNFSYCLQIKEISTQLTYWADPQIRNN